MRKGDAFSVGSMAKIILIVLILFIISSALTGLYGQTFKDGIKNFLGEKTESEITHEQNIQSAKNFELLEKQVKKCHASKDKNCGCLAGLKKFGDDYLVRLTENEVKMINIKNARDASGEDSGIQMASFDVKMDCYWDEDLREEPVKTINFDPMPFITKKNFWIIKDSRYYLRDNFNMLKINSRICWLAGIVNEDKIRDIKECQ